MSTVTPIHDGIKVKQPPPDDPGPSIPPMLMQILEEQQAKLWEAHALVEVISEALVTRFGTDCPVGMPDYPRALRLASKAIYDVSGNLFSDCLDQRMDELEREAAMRISQPE